MEFFTPPILTRGFGITFERWRSPLAYGAISILLGLMLCHSIYGPDIWYHLSWGRSLAFSGAFTPQLNVLLQQPIVANIYWLFQLVTYGVFSLGGAIGIGILFMLLWIFIAACWLVMTGAWKNQNFGPLLFLAFVLCAQLRFEHRPEVFSYLFLVLLLLLLRFRDLGRPLEPMFLLLIFFVQAVWSNSHGYFALGPLLGLALVTSTLWTAGSVERVQVLRASIIAAVLLAGSFVSPFTYHNWELVFGLMDVSRGLRAVNHELMSPEIFPLYWPMQLFWSLWLMTTVWSLRELYLRRSTFSALLALAGAVLALQAIRNSPLYLLLSAPALSGVLVELDRLVARTNKWVTGAIYWMPGLVALGFAVSVYTDEYYFSSRSLATFGMHVERASYPIGATEFMARMDFKGKLFNDSYDGGYVEFMLPDVKVVGDSYFSDAAKTLEYFSAIKEPAALRAMDQRFSFDGILVNVENIEVIESLWRAPEWALAYADSHRLLYMRRPLYNGPLQELSELKLYDGENLRHWVYAYGLSTWAGMALRFNDVNLAFRVLTETSKSNVIPSTSVRYLLGLGVRAGNRELAEAALKLIPKMYETSVGDIQKIDELQAQLRVH